MLLISNGAYFYLLSLENLELIWQHKCRLEGKGLHDVALEGKGIWSLDGRHIILIVLHTREFNYFLRYYDCDNPQIYYDDFSLSKLYRIHDILPFPNLNNYIILVQDELDFIYNLSDRPLVLLRYDGEVYIKYEISSQHGLPLSMEYQKSIEKLIIYTIENVFSCDLEGKNVHEISLETENLYPDKLDMLFSARVNINQIVESKNQKYVYVASNVAFDIYDRLNGGLLYSKDICYGATNIIEIDEEYFIVCKYSGSATLYRILV